MTGRPMRRFARDLVKRAIATTGFHVSRRRTDYHYAPNYYGRSFAHRADIRAVPQFGELAHQTLVEGRSCLYYDRLYILFQVLMNMRRYASGAPFRILEVGVFKGGTTAYLARAAAELGIRGAELHSFDTFDGHAAVDVDLQIDTVHRPGDFHDTSYEGVSSYLAPLGNVTLYKGRFADACTALAAGSIGMMHLDVDLYGPTLHALHFADERLDAGGAIVVDDYEVKSCPGVKAAVDEFLAQAPRYAAIHPLTEQIVLIKIGVPR